MKKLKKIAKKLLPIFGWTAFTVAFFLVMSAARDKQDAVVCKSIDIVITDDDVNRFVQPKHVMSRLLEEQVSLIGVPVGQLDLDAIEQFVESDNYVANAEIFVNRLGELKMSIDQKRPILRVINRTGVSFYIDENGGTIPFSANFTARVPVATGHVKSTRNIRDLERLAKFLSSNELYEQMVQQIIVLENGEFELVPELGNHTVLIGKANKLDKKFKKLMLFYKEGLGHVGWYEYRTINLKYEGQVVCTKI